MIWAEYWRSYAGRGGGFYSDACSKKNLEVIIFLDPLSFFLVFFSSF